MATLLSDVIVSDINSATTPSFTPTADALLVAIIMGTTGFGANTRTFTDSAGLTWTIEDNLFITGYAKTMTIGTAPVGSSPSSMTVTCTSAAADWFATALVVIEVKITTL
jgi:hypothetical protein